MSNLYVTINSILLFDITLHNKLRGENTNIYTSTFLTKYNRNTLIMFVSAADHMALAGISNSLSLLLTLNFLHPQQAPEQVLPLYLEKRPIPSYSAWISCCRFPMTLVTGHGSTKRRPKGSPALSHNHSHLCCGEPIRFPLW